MYLQCATEVSIKLCKQGKTLKRPNDHQPFYRFIFIYTITIEKLSSLSFEINEFIT